MEKINKSLLIELVRNESRLWNQRDKSYYNRDLKPELWDAVGKQLKVTGKLAQKNWESLRDSYRKKLKLVSETKSGQGADPVIKWPYFSSMDFLRDVITPRETSGNLSQTALSQLNDNSDVETEEIPAVDEDSLLEDNDQLQNNVQKDKVNNNQAKLNESHKEIENKRKRKGTGESEALELERRKVQILENRFQNRPKKDDDDDYMFLMSLLPSIKQLEHIQKMRLRMAIMESVTQELEKKKLTETQISQTRPTSNASSYSSYTFVPTPSSSYSLDEQSYPYP